MAARSDPAPESLRVVTEVEEVEDVIGTTGALDVGPRPLLPPPPHPATKLAAEMSKVKLPNDFILRSIDRCHELDSA